jgi:hypothetical protein
MRELSRIPINTSIAVSRKKTSFSSQSLEIDERETDKKDEGERGREERRGKSTVE